MRQTRLQFTYVILSLTIAAGIFNACSRDTLTQDLNISLGSEFLVNPITLQVSDALTGGGIADDVTISIEGKDKDKIYSLLGEKKISLIGNVFALAVKKSDVPNEANPLQFTIILQSPNFVTKRLDYKLTTEEARVDEVKLININTPPASFSVNQTSFSSNSGLGTSQAISFSSPLSNGKVENTVVSVTPGTKLMTASGEEVVGAVQSTLLHSDAKRMDKETGIINWSEEVSVKDATGNDLGKIVLNPAAFFELKMTVGEKVIEKFSSPLNAVTYIDGNTLNAAKNRKVQEGDKVSVYSHSDGQEGWNFEGTSTLSVVGNGKFKVSTQLNHLSTYAFCFDDDNYGKNYCTTKIQILSNIVNNDNDDVCTVPALKYYYRVVSSKNANLVYASGWSNFGNGISIRLFGYPCGTALKISICTDETTTPVLYLDVTAAGTVTIPTDKLKNNSVVALLKVAAICGTGTCTTPDNETCNLTSSVTYVPSATLLYAEISDPTVTPSNTNCIWRPLVRLRQDIFGGKFSTGCARGLQRGKWYDFGIAVKNYNNTGRTQILRYSTCFKFPATNTTGTGSTTAKPYFYIPFDDKITINISSPKWDVTNCLVTGDSKGTNVYNLDFTKDINGVSTGGFQLPCKVCCKISKSFSSFVTAK